MRDIEDLYDEGKENFPLLGVIKENAHMALWVGLGTMLVWNYSQCLGKLYLGFALLNILVIMRIFVCGNCFYNGKTCHIGWGRIAGLYCQPDVRKFKSGFGINLAIWFYLFITVFPITCGLLSLIEKFDCIVLGKIAGFIIIVILNMAPRKKACEQCKMRNICPGSAAPRVRKKE